MSGSWVEANQRYTAACIRRVTAFLVYGPSADVREIDTELRECEAAMDRPPALIALRDAFGLSGFEQDLLTLCAGVALDNGVRRALAEGRGEDSRHSAPTFGLALAVLPNAHWRALTPASPLRRWGLVESGPGAVITECPLSVSERVLHYIAGIHFVDESLGISGTEAAPELTEGQIEVARGAVASIARIQRGRAPADPALCSRT